MSNVQREKAVIRDSQDLEPGTRNSEPPSEGWRHCEAMAGAEAISGLVAARFKMQSHAENTKFAKKVRNRRV